MKIVLAPDKFKGTLTAEQAAEIEKRAILSLIPDGEILCVPLADGGEGTVRTLTAAAGGTLHHVRVTGPLGAPVDACCGIAGDTAFLEMAEASGMVLLRKEERDPMKTSTFGTGELILNALDHGVKHIIIGIGGSATVDGGTGMAEAIGCRFFDKDDKEIKGLCGGKLSAIARIDASGIDPRLRQCSMRIASDVTNPLLGPEGAVAVFAPQKGATAQTMPLLEEGLSNLLSILKKQDMIREDQPGDGAAGGLGLGLRAFCSARSESGAQLAIAAVSLEEKLKDADYLITGEGCSDSQTDNGKLCAVVAALCRKNAVPCILLSGKIIGGALPGFTLSRATVPEEMPFEEIKPRAEELLFDAARQLTADLLSTEG